MDDTGFSFLDMPMELRGAVLTHVDDLHKAASVCRMLRNDVCARVTTLRSINMLPGPFPQSAMGPSLRKVIVKHSYIKSLAHLITHCPGLTHIDCSSTWVADLSPLAACTVLVDLRMQTLHEVSSINPLVACTALQRLDISFCKNVNDVSSLAACTNMRELHMRNTGVSSLVALQSMAGSLEVLDIEHTEVDHIDSIATCSKLVSLNANRTYITDLSPLPTSVLTKLWFAETFVTSLQPLSACHELRHLVLPRTPVADLQPLSACTTLMHLVIDRHTYDIEPLALCTMLEFLDIGISEVTTLEPLRACTRLRKVMLSGTYVRCDKAPIAHVGHVVDTANMD